MQIIIHLVLSLPAGFLIPIMSAFWAKKRFAGVSSCVLVLIFWIVSAPGLPAFCYAISFPLVGIGYLLGKAKRKKDLGF